MVTKALRAMPVTKMNKMIKRGAPESLYYPKPMVGRVTITVSKQSIKEGSSVTKNKQCE